MTDTIQSTYELIKEAKEDSSRNLESKKHFIFARRSKLDKMRNSTVPFNKTQVIQQQVIDSKRSLAEGSYTARERIYPLAKCSQINLNQNNNEDAKSEINTSFSKEKLSINPQQIKAYKFDQNQVFYKPDERSITPSNNISVKIQICTQKHRDQKGDKKKRPATKKVTQQTIQNSKTNIKKHTQASKEFKETGSKPRFLKKGSGHNYNPLEAMKQSSNKCIKKVKSHACISNSSKDITMPFKDTSDFLANRNDNDYNAGYSKKKKRKTIFQKSLNLYKARRNPLKKTKQDKEREKLKDSKLLKGVNSTSELFQKSQPIPNPYNPEESKLKKNCSASNLKLSKRLRDIRLHQHLEESVVAKTVVSDKRSNEDNSYASACRKLSKPLYTSHKEIKRSLADSKDDYGVKSSSKIENSLNSSP